MKKFKDLKERDIIHILDNENNYRKVIVNRVEGDTNGYLELDGGTINSENFTVLVDFEKSVEKEGYRSVANMIATNPHCLIRELNNIINTISNSN